jgi:hypothetical protein
MVQVILQLCASALIPCLGSGLRILQDTLQPSQVKSRFKNHSGLWCIMQWEGNRSNCGTVQKDEKISAHTGNLPVV